MLGHVGLGHVEPFDQLADGRLAGTEQVEDRPPARFGDGVERIGGGRRSRHRTIIYPYRYVSRHQIRSVRPQCGTGAEPGAARAVGRARGRIGRSRLDPGRACGDVERQGRRGDRWSERDRAGDGTGAGGRGARLVLADVEQDALDAAVEGLRSEGIEAHGVICDVRSLDQVSAMADAAFDALGAVHIVFNNAGIAVGGPVLEMTHEDWRWTIDVDLWGPDPRRRGVPAPPGRAG